MSMKVVVVVFHRWQIRGCKWFTFCL